MADSRGHRWRACLTALLLTASSTPVGFNEKIAIVFDDNGKPLLRGDEDYIFGLAMNPEHQIFDVSARTKRALISAAGQPRLWINCIDLSDGVKLCEAKLEVELSASMFGDVPATDFSKPQAINDSIRRGIPTCPGDPRCPRLPSGS